MTSDTGSRGFTLIEVLISISLFALALSLLMGGFRFTSRAWEAEERVTRHTADLTIVHRVFNKMIDRLFPVALDPEAEGYAFIGSSDRLRFTAQLPPYPWAGGLYTIEFGVISGSESDQLELRITPFDAERFLDAELETEHSSRLLETSGRLSFLYFGNDESEEWESEWPESDAPPRWIKLHIEASEEPWPEIVVTVPVDMDHACVFPQWGGECRLDN